MKRNREIARKRMKDSRREKKEPRDIRTRIISKKKIRKK
jgi:hypothetical protein